jgi:hypothetical protein
MPEISRFLGISIRMYRDEHLPPHFHAIYNEFAAQISIRHPAIINGKLRRACSRYVIEWASLHENELAQCWDAARGDQVIGKVEPLI